MKNNLRVAFLIMFFALSASIASAQCVANNDTVSGIEPDTLATAFAGVPYNETIYFRLPADTIVPFVIGGDTFPLHLCIDSLTIDSVIGLPDNFSYECNVPWCAVHGGSNGCASISGMPTAADLGIHPLNVFVSIYTNDCYGFSLPPQPDTVSFYYIDVQQSLGVPLVSPANDFTIGKCFPNPASYMITIPYSSSDDQEMELSVTDLSGRKLMKKQIHAKRGNNIETLDISALNGGMYLVKIRSESEVKLEKFQVISK